MKPGMESIGLVGLTSREGGAAALAPFTLPKPERAARLARIASALGVAELLYLATCHRVELAFRFRDGEPPRDLRRAVFGLLAGREPAPGEAERTLRGWLGEGAVEHLFLVACGLDSAELGEREIQGQLREALGAARAAGTAGVLLDRLTEEALRVAHEVHRATGLGAGRNSLAEIAADFLLERVHRTPSAVALIGVSPLVRRAAEALGREGVEVLLVNRTVEHAAALAAELGLAPDRGRVLSLDAFRAAPPAVEALLTATGAPEAVLDRACLERLAARSPSGEPPLVVDLAVPPDVEPATAAAAGLPRVGMDEIDTVALAGRQRRQVEAAEARARVDAALAELRERLAERMLAPVLARLAQRYRKTAVEGVERLAAREGLPLDAAGREALERWAETLARRFAHLPSKGLRALAAEQGLAAVRSFLAAGDAELAAELAGVADELDTLAAPALGEP